MIKVTWPIFSGLPNPTWTLNESEARELMKRLKADRARGSTGLRVTGPDVHEYVIEATGDDAAAFAAAGIPRVFKTSSLPELEPDAGLLQSQTTALIEDPSSDPDGRDEIEPRTGVCSLYYTSWDNFSWWNGFRQEDNNCYCYGANYAANHFATPGKQGGSSLTAGLTVDYTDQPSHARFTNSMQADGWKLTCTGSSIRTIGVLGKVTRVIDGLELWDFHFYRKSLNDSGASRWCQKQGGLPATNKDASGNYIPNVANADREFSKAGFHYNYNEIVDTFYSPPGERKIVVT
ncbi:hypothetical protein [Nocardioides sp. MH1]|uniref:hypothetical protein n=1 Tax=Nocardioides sp. MH1 TaxID=3242490 RepID=UPI0035229FC6